MNSKLLNQSGRPTASSIDACALVVVGALDAACACMRHACLGVPRARLRIYEERLDECGGSTGCSSRLGGGRQIAGAAQTGTQGWVPSSVAREGAGQPGCCEPAAYHVQSLSSVHGL